MLWFPLTVNSKWVGVNQFISKCVSQGSSVASASSRIDVSSRDPLAHFRYTSVIVLLTIDKPLPVITVDALASTLPSGDRDSVDQTFFELPQPDMKRQTSKVSSRISLKLPKHSRMVGFIRITPSFRTRFHSLARCIRS